MLPDSGPLPLHVNLAVFAAAAALGAVVMLPGVALAHTGEPPAPHDLWNTWTFEPAVLLGIGTAALMYRVGLRRVWGRAGVGRGIRRGEASCFLAGLCALAVALISPVDGVGAALFSVHMVQHLLLVLVAAPLLALGAPLLGFLWALPAPRRRVVACWWHRLPRLRAIARGLAHPVSAWLLSAVALWTWHAPVLYDAAVRYEWVHIAEHASFLATALLFWWVLVQPGGRLRRAGGAGLVYLFGAAMQSGALGALLALSTRPWYGAHLESTAPWGLTPLEDQQIAGAIMWVPGTVIYLLALAVVFAAWLREAERRVQRREQSARARFPGLQGTAAP